MYLVLIFGFSISVLLVSLLIHSVPHCSKYSSLFFFFFNLASLLSLENSSQHLLNNASFLFGSSLNSD